jgi:cellulose synthase/poly-beta-1,6-N-acetylglucosamine synthase-like glycosyltransferase
MMFGQNSASSEAQERGQKCDIAKFMKVSILIPAYNEEKTIRKTIQSCLAQTRAADEVVVVDDGSTDRTADIVEGMTHFDPSVRIVRLPENTGNKSRAQEAGLPHVTGDVIVTADADTLLDARFIEHMLPHFEDLDVAAVAGYVKSIENNWLTASREIDYAIGQDVYKRAQAFIGFVFVVPGCAAAFRASVLKRDLRFDHDTVAEDIDLTFQLHALNREVVFEPQAKVYTQDPPNLRSYVRQMLRWYGGSWENFRKHLPLATKSPSAAFEFSSQFGDCLFFSVLLFAMPFVNPILYFQAFILFFLPQAVLVSAYAAIRRRRADILLYIPGYLLTRFINAWIFVDRFFQIILRGKREQVWLKADRVSI